MDRSEIHPGFLPWHRILAAPTASWAFEKTMKISIQETSSIFITTVFVTLLH